MKILNTFTSFAVLIAFFAACSDDLTQIKFDTDYETTFVIDSGAKADVASSYLSTPIQTNSTKLFEDNNISKDVVKSVKVSKLTLEIMSPDNQTFEILKSVRIYASAEGKEQILLAEIPNNENKGKMIEVSTADVNLMEFIKGETFNIKIDSEVSGDVVEDILIKAKMKLNIVADPLKK